MQQNTKDWVQYGSAIALITSSIVIAFVSFILTLDIGVGTLTYIGEALSGALAIFGISAYAVSAISKFKAEIRDELRKDKVLRNEEN